MSGPPKYADYFSFAERADDELEFELSIASDALGRLIARVKEVKDLGMSGSIIDLAYQIIYEDMRVLRAAQERALGWKPEVVGGKASPSNAGTDKVVGKGTGTAKALPTTEADGHDRTTG